MYVVMVFIALEMKKQLKKKKKNWLNYSKLEDD